MPQALVHKYQEVYPKLTAQNNQPSAVFPHSGGSSATNNMARMKASRQRMRTVRRQAVTGSMPFNLPKTGAKTRDEPFDFDKGKKAKEATQPSKVGTNELRDSYADHNFTEAQPTLLVSATNVICNGPMIISDKQS